LKLTKTGDIGEKIVNLNCSNFLPPPFMKLPHSIMLIDDDEDDRALFFEALMEVAPSCRFMSAVNGKDGLNKLQQADVELPHLVFLDLNMPGMNGMQCLSQMQSIKRLKDIPVIIYSTTSLFENIEAFTAFETVYFLTKPTRFKEIVQVLSFLLRNKWWEEEKIKNGRVILVR
jgi:CheY-like chemotaxis protein